MAVGFMLPFAIGVPLWWAFPPLEMFDEGGAGRFRRFRGGIFGVLGAITVGVISSVVYAAVA
jgi:hypothetical protein